MPLKLYGTGRQTVLVDGVLCRGEIDAAHDVVARDEESSRVRERVRGVARCRLAAGLRNEHGETDGEDPRQYLFLRRTSGAALVCAWVVRKLLWGAWRFIF